MPKADLSVNIRWMIKRDMPEVLEIDRQAFMFPWSEEEFYKHLAHRNCIGMVAEIGNVFHQIVGFAIYQLDKPMLTILRFAVHPGFRRAGVGQQMVMKLLAKTTRRRPKISVLCRETNLDACFFWRSMGFHATDVYRGHYDDTGEDAYHFLAQVDPVGAPR